MIWVFISVLHQNLAQHKDNTLTAGNHFELFANCHQFKMNVCLIMNGYMTIQVILILDKAENNDLKKMKVLQLLFDYDILIFLELGMAII